MVQPDFRRQPHFLHTAYISGKIRLSSDVRFLYIGSDQGWGHFDKRYTYVVLKGDHLRFRCNFHAFCLRHLLVTLPFAGCGLDPVAQWMPLIAGTPPIKLTALELLEHHSFVFWASLRRNWLSSLSPRWQDRRRRELSEV
jgi:hypothetical protein